MFLQQVGLVDVVQLTNDVIVSAPEYGRVSALSALLAELAAGVPRGLAGQDHAASPAVHGEKIPGHVFQVQMHGRLLVGHVLAEVELL
jgi:hypothetical protein